jgi:hypothetical protein
LLLSKLAWAGGVSELQQRDVAKLVRHVADIDWEYVERWALEPGVRDAVLALRGRT